MNSSNNLFSLISMCSIALISNLSTAAWAFQTEESVMAWKTPFSEDRAPNQIVLQNDSFADNSGQAYIQQGFVAGEKVGIWVQVPSHINKFKIDSFRVLMGGPNMTPSNPEMLNNQVYFSMGLANEGAYSPEIPAEIENFAQITPGPYWNDIPAMGSDRALSCATAGQLIGAALEFMHAGLPSVYRDLDGISDIRRNSLMAIPGGWQYSVSYGLRGDWILRIVGHEAKEGECR